MLIHLIQQIFLSYGIHCTSNFCLSLYIVPPWFTEKSLSRKLDVVVPYVKISRVFRLWKLGGFDDSSRRSASLEGSCHNYKLKSMLSGPRDSVAFENWTQQRRRIQTRFKFGFKSLVPLLTLTFKSDSGLPRVYNAPCINGRKLRKFHFLRWIHVYFYFSMQLLAI